MRRSEGENEAHVGRDTEFRVGESAREGGRHRGFVRVVAVQVGDFDLQGDVFLVAQLDHGDVILPLTATTNLNSKERVRGFSREKTKKKQTCFLLHFKWSEALVVSCHVTVAI